MEKTGILGIKSKGLFLDNEKLKMREGLEVQIRKYWEHGTPVKVEFYPDGTVKNIVRNGE